MAEIEFIEDDGRFVTLTCEYKEGVKLSTFIQRYDEKKMDLEEAMYHCLMWILHQKQTPNGVNIPTDLFFAALNLAGYEIEIQGTVVDLSANKSFPDTPEAFIEYCRQFDSL